MKRDLFEGISEFIPELPSLARTRGGACFDPRADKWVYRDGINNVSLDFAPTSVLGGGFQQSLKAVLLWYAESVSASHLMNVHSRVVHFLRFISGDGTRRISEISSTDVLNYKSSLTASTAWYLGTLSGVLKKWNALGISGVTDDAVSLLKGLRVKGNAKGVAVLTMDPVDGPYTNIELEAILAALDSAYVEGTIDDTPYLLAWLFIALGQRPAQYAALKVCDILTGSSEAGDVAYVLRVPRVKQRNVHPRAEFKERPLDARIGGHLFEYAQRVKSSYTGRLADPSQAPLFPQTRPRSKQASGYEFHHTGLSMAEVLKAALNKLQVCSERTGDLLHITPVRFRRTVGTRAAQEGHGELVIAEMLDHSDTQNVGIYVAAVPEIAARIDKAVAMELAPLAQAFTGRLIQDESEATRHDDPSSRIIDLRIDRSAQPMGSCGQYSFCGFSAPIACYTCKNFEPWLDGPHEAVLAHLLSKRDQLLKTTDERMASINDRTILAVAQVIQSCQASLAKGGVSNG